MSEFKFTKGIWNVDKRASRRVFVGNQTIASTSSSQNGDNEEEEVYNALLISKAPELLAMLQDVKDLLDSYPSESEMHLKASEIRSLIKEATEL